MVSTVTQKIYMHGSHRLYGTISEAHSQFKTVLWCLTSLASAYAVFITNVKFVSYLVPAVTRCSCKGRTAGANIDQVTSGWGGRGVE